MNEYEEREEKLSRLANIWKTSRNSVRKSQDYMALELGVAKKTIQNWERGYSAPTIYQAFEWFDVLGINPISYYMEYLFPDEFKDIDDEVYDDGLEDALDKIISQLTVKEKKQLLFILAGNHGSSSYSLLQVFTAHCHTTMKSRVNAARLISENYIMEVESGDAVCKNRIEPDMELIEKAITKGKEAFINKKDGYTIALT